MSDESYTVSVTCLFCDSVLQGNDEVKLASGDLIRCSQCGQENDFDSVVEVANNKAMKQLQDDLLSKATDIFRGK